jgi:glycerol-3-phosphate cytidylyltransferase-like family protein
MKNKKSYGSFEDRKIILESIRYVDFVFPENSWDQKIQDVLNYVKLDPRNRNQRTNEFRNLALKLPKL